MRFTERMSDRFAEHPLLRTFLAGFSLGLVALSLIFGSAIWLYLPAWAAIFFFPGFLTGKILDPLLGFTGAVIGGGLAQAIAYGLLAAGIRLLIRDARNWTSDSTSNSNVRTSDKG